MLNFRTELIINTKQLKFIFQLQEENKKYSTDKSKQSHPQVSLKTLNSFRCMVCETVKSVMQMWMGTNGQRITLDLVWPGTSKIVHWGTSRYKHLLALFVVLLLFFSTFFSLLWFQYSTVLTLILTFLACWFYFRCLTSSQKMQTFSPIKFHMFHIFRL